MKNEKARKYLYRKGGYVYFRYRGEKPIALPRDERSAEFQRSYAACLAAVRKESARPAAIKISTPRDLGNVGFIGATIGAAIAKYIDSLEFTRLKERTQYNYRKALDHMRDLIGTTLLADLDTDAVDIYSELIAKKFATATADQHVNILVRIWDVCRKHPEFGLKGKSNPMRDAATRHINIRPHKKWSDEAEARFIETAPSHLKLAALLLHFSAQRGGDCVKLRWDDFDGRGIYVRPEKTDGQNSNPESNYHLCPRRLLDALNAEKRSGKALADTILTTSFGRPWASAMTLSKAIREHLEKIGLRRPGERTISMHGLRKTAASEVGSIPGVGVKGIKTVTGHLSDRMAAFYAEEGEKRTINESTVAAWDDLIEAKAAGTASGRRARLRRVK